MPLAEDGLVPGKITTMSNPRQDALSLAAYHARTKHRFEAYAEGPGQLDWDAQPAAFRHYDGAPRLELPLAAGRFERPFGRLIEPPVAPVAADRDSLGALLELAFGVSAWKRWGPSRWALRCNPSSGNLHPVDAYVLAAGLPRVPDGLHHYDPERHALEGRATAKPYGADWLAVGLSSAMWREAWKYGERAFRYCQLDVGHALGALAYAAALLGWETQPLSLPHAALAHALGLERVQDFPPARHAYTEVEEPEILIALGAPGLAAPPLEALASWLDSADWQGTPSRIDPAPGYRWPIIDEAAAASRRMAVDMTAAPAAAALPPLPPMLPLFGPASDVGAARLMRQRRSAQRFDARGTLSKAAFYRMLDAVLPRSQAPFTAQEAAPAIHLLLFVMRVEGLPSGLYLLPRTPEAAALLPGVLVGHGRFAEQRRVADIDPDCPPHLDLIRLAELGLPEIQRLARALSCHQDIAATSAYSLGMLGDFAAVVTDGHAYRRLLREAGLVGQALYLEAEAANVRGTGIGCFFDDPVHQVFGIADARWQSVYHFTVGTPVLDERIETEPAYPDKAT
jgi:SagB-type dehydrogenase family enzyme